MGKLIIFEFANFQTINSIISGTVAAVFCYYINSYALKLVKEKAIVYFAPIIEEVSKTGFALLFNGNIIISHTVFGIIEGVYDICKNKSVKGCWAGFSGIASHFAFGTITAYIIKTKTIAAGLIAASVVHGIWNRLFINK